MREGFPGPNQEKDEKKKVDFEKVNRLKDTLMKLERSVISEADEGVQSVRGAIQAMGFGIQPVIQQDEDDEEMAA